MFNRLLAVLLTSLTLAATARAAEPLVLLTENFPPYNMSTTGKSFAREDKIQGIATELVREMFKRAAIPYSMTLKSTWSEIYKQALETPGYGVFVLARQPDRENLFKWVGPLGPDDWILLGRKDSQIQLASLNAARGYRIGAYKGDAIAEHLGKNGLRPALVLRDQDNAKRLVNGEIDLWATGDPAGRYLAKQVGITGLKTILRFNGAELYLALNKQVPDDVQQALQRALDQMRQDGFVDEVFARYL